jgi:hypothetical protein
MKTYNVVLALTSFLFPDLCLAEEVQCPDVPSGEMTIRVNEQGDYDAIEILVPKKYEAAKFDHLRVTYGEPMQIKFHFREGEAKGSSLSFSIYLSSLGEPINLIAVYHSKECYRLLHGNVSLNDAADQ